MAAAPCVGLERHARRRRFAGFSGKKYSPHIDDDLQMSKMTDPILRGKDRAGHGPSA